MVLIILAVVILSGSIIYFALSFVAAIFIAKPLNVPISKTPASLGLDYEDVSFRSRVDGLILKGWYIPGVGKGTIIVVHGGKQNRADATMQLIELCGDLAQRGFNILTFDKQGCGESALSGRKERARSEWDVGGAFDYIRARSGSGEEIFLSGISISAIATFVFASQEEGVNGIVSDSCFASTPEMLRRALATVNNVVTVFTPGVAYMGKLIYGFKPISAIDNVGSVSCPILFIHGEADDGVPPEDARRLFAASNNYRDELWIVAVARHSQAYRIDPNRYVDRVAAFLSDNCCGTYKS